MNELVEKSENVVYGVEELSRLTNFFSIGKILTEQGFDKEYARLFHILSWKNFGKILRMEKRMETSYRYPVISLRSSSISILNRESDSYRRLIRSKEEWIVA